MNRRSLLVVLFLGLLACPSVSEDAEGLRRSCDAGIAAACSDLGSMYATGEAITQDLARATSLYRQACEGGAMQGCFDLGLLYGNGVGDM